MRRIVSSVLLVVLAAGSSTVDAYSDCWTGYLSPSLCSFSDFRTKG